MTLTRKKPMERGAFDKPSFSRLQRKEEAEAKPAKGPRRRLCKHCKSPFTPFRDLEGWCSPVCGLEVAKARLAAQRAKLQRKERAETKAKLIEMKPRKWWLAKAKKQMHLYVRLRDNGKSCCSCDRILNLTGKIGGDYDAGHLRSVGSAKHLEFDPRNVWGQCKFCNDKLHGNEREYERRLRLKEGDSLVDNLMADNTERHLKITDFQEIEAYYKLKIKELKNDAQN